MLAAVDAIGIQVVVNGIDALRHIRALDPTSCALPRPVDVRYLADTLAREWALLALGT
ncbi:MAG TPA: hypothetical protein VGU22_02795 [Methylomirabilota bacterium]|jgi:hypothetical protein|nr:hypothetical protein [Methylomirabilota bacterium]